jgi:hypothetical protein
MFAPEQSAHFFEHLSTGATVIEFKRQNAKCKWQNAKVKTRSSSAVANCL